MRGASPTETSSCYVGGPRVDNAWASRCSLAGSLAAAEAGCRAEAGCTFLHDFDLVAPKLMRCVRLQSQRWRAFKSMFVVCGCEIACAVAALVPRLCGACAALAQRSCGVGVWS